MADTPPAIGHYLEAPEAERDAARLRRCGFHATAVVEGMPHRRWWVRLELVDVGPAEVRRLLGWRRRARLRLHLVRRESVR